MDPPTARPTDDALARLRPLVGEWVVETIPPGAPERSVEGTTIVSWHPGGAHLLVHTTNTSPTAPPDGWSIIGCDAANGTYTQLYADERGVCRTYAMTIDERVWTLHREGAPFDQRFRGEFNERATEIVGQWERRDTGTWETDLHLVYRRLGTPRLPG